MVRISADASARASYVFIDRLTHEDCSELAASFEQIGWNKPVALFERYLAEQDAGERLVLVAHADGELAGYLTVHWVSDYQPFRDEDIPEITDLNVLPHWRRKGIASRLMDEAEVRIAEQSSTAGIGVGMGADYGPAQRMYVLRGYVPDARGLTYSGRNLEWGEAMKVDDGLVLMLMKTLRE